MQYHQHIDSGNKLTIPYQSIISSRHVVSQPEFVLSLSRSLSRLKQLYFVCVANTADITRDFRQTINGIDNFSNTTDIMSFEVQVGSSRFPDTPCLGIGESYFRLLQATGREKDKEDIAISPTDYCSDCAIFGIDFEKAGNEALFTGISTRDGKIMTLHVKNSQVTATAPHTIFVYQVYDGVCNIRKAAVDVEE